MYKYTLCLNILTEKALRVNSLQEYRVFYIMQEYRYIKGVIMRLDKYLADMGRGTRSELKKAIRKGRVRVDGTIVTDPGYAVETSSSVSFDGEPVVYQETVWLMLNKPAGVITAANDSSQKTVMDLVVTDRKDLFPVGRLDRDTEGLLLLTNDGDLAHRLLSPRRYVDKVYHAVLDGPVPDKEAQLFREGLRIEDDDPFTALPADLEILSNGTEALVTLREGKYHQVKRMFAAVGRKVLKLKRLSMGPLKLDPELKSGEWRPLTGAEIDALKKAVA